MSKHEHASHLDRRSYGSTDLPHEATRDISAALSGLLADVFALYEYRDRAFHPLFAAGALRAFLIGDGRLFPIAGAALSPD